MPPQRVPIIGQPIGDTPLEAMLRAAFEAVGADLELVRWERRPHQLAHAIDELRAEGFAGAIVASPHKERAAALADALSPDARASGAVNVLVASRGRLRGANTDIDAVRAGLAEILPAAQGKWPRHAVVLGAGGGARAVVAVLIGASFQHIAVFNRHLHRAEALVAHFARGARHIELRARPWHDAILEAELERAPLVVNASGIGVEEGASPIPLGLLPPERYVLDLVLNHEVTPLMAVAAERGGTVANGRAAFLVGCATLVRLLTGAEAPDEVLRGALATDLGLPEDGLAVVGD